MNKDYSVTEISNANTTKWIREYFEQGCLCIANGDMNKLPEETPDREAATYYQQHCACSRNYQDR